MKIPDFSDRPLAELFGLSGRVGMVTGGGRGIGRAYSLRLAEAGCAVAVADLDLDSAGEVRDEIKAAGGKATAVEVDVSQEDSFESAFDQVEGELGVVDALVNNAGIYPMDFVFDTTVEQWDRVMNVNLRSSFVGSKLAAERMIAADKRGVLLNVSSTAGVRLVHGQGLHYPSAKAGVAMLVQTLGVELGKYGIRSVGIAPGLSVTPGVEAELANAGGDLTEEFAGAIESAPLGRLIVPDDLARVAVFLLSDLAAMITSQVVVVDGARMAGRVP
jgi:NAD(P)-dependent dehydrogenase (short-subunit alcohol dehydrogenase family)